MKPEHYDEVSGNFFDGVSGGGQESSEDNPEEHDANKDHVGRDCKIKNEGSDGGPEGSGESTEDSEDNPEEHEPNNDHDGNDGSGENQDDGSAEGPECR